MADRTVPEQTPAGQYLKDDFTWGTPSASSAPAGSTTQIQFNDGGVMAGDAGFVWNKTSDILKIGTGTMGPSEGSNICLEMIKAGGNAFMATQFAQNTSAGTLSSSDLLIGNDSSSDTAHYMDLGISSTTNSDGNYDIGGNAGDGYLYNQTGVLWFATANATGKNIIFGTGGTTAAKTRMTISGTASTVTIGKSGTTTGTLAITGATSGTANITVAAAAGTPTITLPTATGTLATLAGTETFTNKRNTSRTGTTASSATPTINTDNVDMYLITAQTVDITSFTTNLTGTPTEGQTLWIVITGTAARAITWGAKFEASGNVPLPTTTVSTTRLDVGFVWNTVSSAWRCVAQA